MSRLLHLPFFFCWAPSTHFPGLPFSRFLGRFARGRSSGASAITFGVRVRADRGNGAGGGGGGDGAAGSAASTDASGASPGKLTVGLPLYLTSAASKARAASSSSSIAQQAKILVAEAEENDLDDDAFDARWVRWYTCRLCEQGYHGVVQCALGWACWKTYVGRPEGDEPWRMAMNLLGNGLGASNRNEDALPVQEAELSTLRRLGGSEASILITQGNLASTYQKLGRHEEALRVRQEVYGGHLKLSGEENRSTLIGANNYASSLVNLERFEEAKSLMCKTIPVARRVLGEGHDITLKLRWLYARARHEDPTVTLGNLREAVNTLEDTERTARRVLGGAHPVVGGIARHLQDARDALYARGLP